MIETPCTGICQLHPKTGLCLGCGRTGSEIGAWSALSRADRTALMAELPARLETAEMKTARRRAKIDA
ncbi:DUF1289 domain-containing protein [Fulvimarina endophytica]|uniref:DUF1289 domain-containing protein n=1 Tax=Fulvimarina endophytica TaxID=2293836 RepID=A0A371X7G2_9HYPH|nr:DUF1289 domain-containing protein [Fulvimarina endophytica]RFC65172.1 DUF1289 domain-containing protein [Fulvimarina endophytica]